MSVKGKTPIKVAVSVKGSMARIWQFWTEPEHIKKWNNASDTWHTPKALNDLRPGGAFNFRMEAKDGSFGFDFEGIYDDVQNLRLISYTLGDGRKVEIRFEEKNGDVSITELFEAESENSPELQRQGWQAILNNFKLYAES